jgi:hypothetical protein
MKMTTATTLDQEQEQSTIAAVVSATSDDVASALLHIEEEEEEEEEGSSSDSGDGLERKCGKSSSSSELASGVVEGDKFGGSVGDRMHHARRQPKRTAAKLQAANSSCNPQGDLFQEFAFAQNQLEQQLAL